ncbi:MAG: tetratricopeptide repeat protein [Desulfomonilaceae bacterium]
MFRATTSIAAVIMIIGLGSLCMPPSSHASAELQRGLAAARSGRLDRAVSLWSAAIRKNPKCYAAYVDRGSAYLRSGYVLRGVLDWHKAQGLSPAFAYSAYYRDFITEASGDPAVLNYAMPLELDPDHVTSVLMTAVTYLDVGRADKALELYRNSVELTKNPLLKSYFDYWINSIHSSAEH